MLVSAIWGAIKLSTGANHSNVTGTGDPPLPITGPAGGPAKGMGLFGQCGAGSLHAVSLAVADVIFTWYHDLSQ